MNEQTSLLVRGLIRIASDVADGRATIEETHARLLKAVSWVEATFPSAGKGGAPRVHSPPASPAEGKVASAQDSATRRREAAKRLFVYWRDLTNRPRSKLTNDKLQKLIARLREGYTEEQLRAAIRAAASDPFYQGENDRSKRYDTIETICRNGTRIESLLERASDAGVDVEMPSRAKEPDDLRRLREEARDALRDGRVEDYNRATRAIEALRAVRTGQRADQKPDGASAGGSGRKDACEGG